MKPVLMSAMVIALVATAGVGAAGQVGITLPRLSLHDSVPTSPLFNPSTKSTLPARSWTVPPPAHIADISLGQVGAMQCPMPVFAPDSTKQDRIPVSRSKSALVQRIPVAKSDCTNPLGKKPRP